MKKISILVIFITINLLIFAQNASIIPIIGQTAEYIELIEKKYEQQVVHLEFDVFQDYKEVYRDMFEDVQYGIILFGDEHFENVSLSISVIENDELKTVASAEGDKGIVVLYFTPTITDFYKFEITGKLLNGSNFGFYSFLIFR